MRRRVAFFLTLLALLAAAAMPVWAAEKYVVDDADILTDGEEQTLERMAGEIAEMYDCDVHILTVYDYRDYGTGDVRYTAEQYFTANGLGQGSDQNGVLLMLSMAERDYTLIAHGALANGAFTDYGKEVLSKEFLDDFRYDDWYDGFYDYLDGCEELLDAAKRGKPVDVSGAGEGMIWVVLLAPLAVAGIACGCMVASMKSARKQTYANAYIPDGGIQLTASADRFVNRTVVRQKIEEKSSSGGGTRVNSRGFSGRSGKF